MPLGLVQALAALVGVQPPGVGEGGGGVGPQKW